MTAPADIAVTTSRGRQHAEPEDGLRTPFMRDRDRIIHSTAFRRLKHKTQVFIAHEGDHYRTRLTHSLEVAQIARTLARVLGLNEDLTEALALAHDLGHTPFGHAGEAALAACMADAGGFEHNAQALRIVTRLERRYAAFDGLNLTWDTLEGLVKHNGPLTDAAGLIDLIDLGDLPLAGEALAEVVALGDLARERLIHELVRRLIARMVTDVLDETRRRLERLRPQTADDVRALDGPLVAFSAQMRENVRRLQSFLTARVYRHARVMERMRRARRILEDLFTAYVNDPDLLPDDWRRRALAAGERRFERQVCDFIAGMTDTYAIRQHKRLFDLGAGLG